jgi:hypothetical protein
MLATISRGKKFTIREKSAAIAYSSGVVGIVNVANACLENVRGLSNGNDRNVLASIAKTRLVFAINASCTKASMAAPGAVDQIHAVAGISGFGFGLFGMT